MPHRCGFSEIDEMDGEEEQFLCVQVSPRVVLAVFIVPSQKLTGLFGEKIGGFLCEPIDTGLSRAKHKPVTAPSMPEITPTQTVSSLNADIFECGQNKKKCFEKIVLCV